MAKRKRTNTDLQNITQKTKDRVTRTLTKIRGWTQVLRKGDTVPVPLVAPVVSLEASKSKDPNYDEWLYMLKLRWHHRVANSIAILSKSLILSRYSLMVKHCIFGLLFKRLAYFWKASRCFLLKLTTKTKLSKGDAYYCVM